MAAGQQKKRLTNYNLHEQYKGKKKKKLDSSDCVMSLRSHIYLEWDGSKKQALAKREQVGITWKDMAAFVDSFPQFQSGLADVLSVPEEIFDFENLKEILSFEVWETCLSESERELLTQFLPSGTDAEQAVHSLLMGENHHFGNPFLKWSASLCSGNLHPDNVLCMEQQFRVDKKAYYSELNQYHKDMIAVLKKWKERWAGSKDPEILRRGFTQLKQETSPTSVEQTKVSSYSKKEMLHNIVRNGDTEKYISYIKISKKQFDLVKNLKHSGDGIKSKSLNHVIGDIKGFDIHSYEAFEEEEKKRLHEHWLQVVNKDLPSAFEVWMRRKSQRRQCWMPLVEELAEKRKLVMNPSSSGAFFKQRNKTNHLESLPRKQIVHGETELPVDIIHQDEIDSASNSAHDRPLEMIPSLSGDQELSPAVLVQEVRQNDMLKPVDNSPVLSEFLREKNDIGIVMESRSSISPASDLWHNVNIRDSHYPTTSGSHRYTSASELSLRQPPVPAQCPTQMIDLDRGIMKHESRESVASALQVGTVDPLLYSYENQSREYLPFFPKEFVLLSGYPQSHMNDSKQCGLQPLMETENLSESSQFPHQFLGQQRVVEQRQAKGKEFSMHQVMNKSIYTNGSYPIQGQLPSVEPHGLLAMQSPVSGGLLSHNWFPEECRTRKGWSGVESTGGGEYLGDGGNTDGSLYSVLSECENLPSRVPSDSASSAQFTSARNFVSGGVSNDIGTYMHASQQLRGSSGHDLPVVPSDFNMTWMNYPYQNSSLRDSIRKPFLRSCNQ